MILNLRFLKAEERQSFIDDNIADYGPMGSRVQPAYIPAYKFVLVHVVQECDVEAIAVTQRHATT